MTKNDVNKAFRVLFRVLLGLPDNSIRPSYQTGLTGDDELFGTVTVVNVDGVEWGQRTLKDDPLPSVDMTETITGHLTITLSVQFYRAGAYDTVMRLTHLLQSSAGIDAMRAVGVGLVSIGSIRDLTSLIDTYFEDRGQVDLTFHINSIFTSNIRSLVSGTFEIIFEPDTHQLFTMEFQQ